MEVGQIVTYYPQGVDAGENMHLPAEVLGFTSRRVRIKAFIMNFPEGKRVTVSPRRLVEGQMQIFEDDQ